MIFYIGIYRFTGEIWLLDHDGDLILGMKRAQKPAVYILIISTRKSRYKANLSTIIYSGVARVTQYGLLLQISQKSVAGGTIDGMHLHFSKNSFTFPVMS